MLRTGNTITLLRLMLKASEVMANRKGKMEERKSWASSAMAKRHHTLFECLSHHPCLIIEHEMEGRGLQNDEEKKTIARESS